MPASRLRPGIILILLWAAYFHPLILHPAQTLYTDYSDFASEHLPGRIFLVREWHATGRLPLWNPYHFCGSPFVHDIQVGTFYPPYMLTLLFHENDAGAVMSWLIALHVLAASVFGFLYARFHGLSEAGSLVMGIGFAYSAKWLTHLILAGHTITIGLAWLPLVLLGYEAFIRNRNFAALLAAGVSFALLILGTHPQWTFYAGLFVAAWTLTAKPGLLRWLGGGVGVVLIAVALAAVQLLPTLEATRYSSRSVGLEASQALATGVFSLLAPAGPTVEYAPLLSWELRSLLSLFGLAAAFAAPDLAPGVRWNRLVLVAMLVFAFGGSVVFESLPGFNLFRAPARMLVIAAFPVAFLAAAAIDALIAGGWEESKRRTLRNWMLIVVPACSMPSIASALFLWKGQPMWPEFGIYWASAGLGFGAVLAACFALKLPAKKRTGLLLGAMFLELLGPTCRFPAVKPQSEMYPDSDLVEFLNANADEAAARVIDIEMGSQPTDRLAPLGIGSPQALTHRIAMPRGYNPLDVHTFRQYLNFVMDSDEQVLSLSPLGQPIVPNFPRVSKPIWEQLNVRYLVCFENYMTNEEYKKDPANALLTTDWRFATQFKTTPAVPELPPIRPDPLPRVLVWENRHFAEHPRAFVVPDSAPMPAGKELIALKNTDLRRTVLIADGATTKTEGSWRPAAVRQFTPNRVTVDLGGGSGGWLVLSEVWFPGWACRVDGIETEVRRGNYAFRAVPIPAGAKEAVFEFDPPSYRLGWSISSITLGITLLLGSSALVRLARRRSAT